MVLVFLPRNIADDLLRGIVHDLGKLGVAHRGLLAPDGQEVVAQSAAIMRRWQSENERRWRERRPVRTPYLSGQCSGMATVATSHNSRFIGRPTRVKSVNL